LLTIPISVQLQSGKRSSTTKIRKTEGNPTTKRKRGIDIYIN
jgi:hypothetical protein